MGGFVSGFGQSMGGNKAQDAINKLRSKHKKSSDSSDSTSSASGSGDFETDAGIMHKGGMVKKTKIYKLKKGERVLTKGQQRKLGIGKRMRGK